MGSRSFKSVTAYVVVPLLLAAVVIAVAVYITRDRERAQALRQTVASSSENRSGLKFACPVVLPTGTTSEEARVIERRAQKEMGAGQFERALQSFRELSVKDPAFPGVNLDISMALSKLDQPQPARQAVDAQLSISMCLAQLFPNELEPYCKAEAFPTTAACVKELGSVQQGAYIQAALTQMDPDPGQKPKHAEPGVAAAVSAPAIKIVPAPKIASAAKAPSAANQPKPATIVARVVAPRVRSKSAADSLASGAGTDAALGAYSK